MAMMATAVSDDDGEPETALEVASIEVIQSTREFLELAETPLDAAVVSRLKALKSKLDQAFSGLTEIAAAS